jgi:hypothetical protein
MFKENKYTKTYYNIIKKAKSRSIFGYTECHHIIPKSLGGLDDANNLVNLTAREHYLCHLLLVKMTDGIAYQKMIYAYKIMSGRKLYNSKSYHFFKEEYSKVNSKLRSGNGNGMYGANRKGENNTFFGKKHTQETKDLISKKKKGVSITQPPMTQEHCKKISESRKGTGVVYSFIHPLHGEFVGSIQSLCREFSETFNKSYHKAEVWKLTAGKYKSCKGWKINPNYQDYFL